MSKEDSIKLAAQALVDKLHAIAADPRYISVWTLYQVHGGKYEGPFYVDELTALEKALAEPELQIGKYLSCGGDLPKREGYRQIEIDL